MTDSKARLWAAWRGLLEERLAAARSLAAAAREGTRVDGSHRPANRGERAAVTGQGYLAHGLGQRLSALEQALARLAQLEPGPRGRLGTGALAEVSIDGEEQVWLAVLPGGDASVIELGARRIRVLSPRAPLVRALWGARPGDEAEALLGGEERELELLQVG